jgi:uncharacterized protein
MDPVRRWPVVLSGVALLFGAIGRGETVATPTVALAGPKPIVQLEHEAAAGSVDAQLELALAYDEQGGPERKQKAAEWYRRAADQGSGAAHLRLGTMSETGEGVPQSYAEAKAHYEQAVSRGLAEANFRLGILYVEGWGVKQDRARALTYIEQAAAAGYRAAQLVASDMYAVGLGAKRDPAKALAWAQRAAADKDPAGEIRVGALASKRNSAQRDVQLAREWYQLSAEQEYSRGMLAMAGTFLQPGHSAEEIKLGVEWLKLAAENGNTAAMFYLAAYFARSGGQDELANTATARQWLQRASDAGESIATEILDLETQGWKLNDAFQQVLTVPQHDRYVQRFEKQRDVALQNPMATRQPIPVKMVDPVYPMALRLTETSGDVLVDFTVDTTGRVRDAKVIKTPHPAFSSRALEAVQQWVFLPACRNGQLVKTHMRVPIRFKLTDIHPQRPSNGPMNPDMPMPSTP